MNAWIAAARSPFASAIRAVRSAIATAATSAAALAAKIKEGKVKDGFTLWDVYNKGWSLLDTADIVAGACDELEALGWIRKEMTIPQKGRPKTEYRVNPNVMFL